MNKKILGVLAGVTLLASFAAILPGALAKENDNNSNEDNARKELKSIGSTLEVHIYDNGKVLVRGAKVTAVSGATVTATTAWGSTSLSWTVNTDSSTEFVRNFGGKSGVSEISAGNYISFNGDLVITASGLTVNAKTLKNWSVQKKNASFIGNVLSIGATSFVLKAEERGTVTVNVISSTSFTKSDSNAAFGDMRVGDKVLASGLFDNSLMTLVADKVKIYADKKAEQHTFEGTLKATAGTTAPTSLTLAIERGADLTVNVPVGISIINKNYLVIPLSDFRIGDKIRVWGLGIGTVVDATVIRDTNLPR